MLSRSTQTEVNEHVCLQLDVSVSEPAVKHLEGKLLKMTSVLVCYLHLFSISSIYLDFFLPFKVPLSRSSGGRMNVTLLLKCALQE